MTVLAIAAASAIRTFDPKRNKKHGQDRNAFVACVRNFFPWEDVGVTDDQYRAEAQLRDAASEGLYDVVRCPLIHAGGVVGKGFPIIQSMTVYPGLKTQADNEQVIADLCSYESLDGQCVFEMSAEAFKVHTRVFYWAARKMVEAFAADPRVQNDIERNLLRP